MDTIHPWNPHELPPAYYRPDVSSLDCFQFLNRNNTSSRSTTWTIFYAMGKKISIWLVDWFWQSILCVSWQFLITYATRTQNQVLTANCFCNPCTATKGGWLNHWLTTAVVASISQQLKVSVRFDSISIVSITVLSFLSFFRLSWSQYNSTIICIFWSLGRFASIISSYHCSAVVPTSGQLELSQQPALLIATCAGSQNINILTLKRSWLSELRSQFSKTSKMTFCMTQSVKVVVEEVWLSTKLWLSTNKQPKSCWSPKEQKSEYVLPQTNRIVLVSQRTTIPRIQTPSLQRHWERLKRRSRRRRKPSRKRSGSPMLVITPDKDKDKKEAQLIVASMVVTLV